MERYDDEGRDEVAASKTRDEALSRVEAVRVEWAPRWKAWDEFSDAHALWADALEKGQPTGAKLEAMKGAFCALMHLWPKGVPKPIVPMICGEETPR